MADLFESPRLTILRAQHHINDLNSKINEFVSNQPWSHRVESNAADPSHEIHKIVFERRLPADLPCIVFDAASNLHAALDQVGYAAALAARKIAPGKPERPRTNFPSADTLTNLDNHIDNRGACDDLPAEIIALFRSFKPYNGGNDTLRALHRLCNTNKHCALVPFDLGQFNLFRTTEISKTTRPLPGGGGEIRIHTNIHGFTGRLTPANSSWDAEKHEIAISGIPREMGAQYKANVALNVAIEGIQTLSRQPAVTVLNNMMRVVESIIAATEAECRRLGFI